MIKKIGIAIFLLAFCTASLAGTHTFTIGNALRYQVAYTLQHNSHVYKGVISARDTKKVKVRYRGNFATYKVTISLLPGPGKTPGELLTSCLAATNTNTIFIDYIKQSNRVICSSAN